jgi:hypothetical protein
MAIFRGKNGPVTFATGASHASLVTVDIRFGDSIKIRIGFQ